MSPAGSPSGARGLLALLAAASLCWHLLAVLSPAWTGVQRAPGGRDFASYYYAARVALDGGDPYDKAALGAAAREDGARASVHPFFYPPPFVAASAWVTAFDLPRAFRVWFWLDEVFALAAALALAAWWRSLDPLAPGVVAVVFALATALPNNHAMGQANLPVMAALIAGLWAERAGRPALGGALVGVACMAKMSPALFVAWWLLRGAWRPAAAACATAVVLSVAALPVVGPETQVGFYTRVLPAFASGDYNGLSVPIQLYGNHSIPNVLDRWLPSADAALSPAARAVSAVLGIGAMGVLAALFRKAPDDEWSIAGQIAAIGALMLLLPVYTYEHHLVWALPAAALAVLAVGTGRIGPVGAAPLGMCIAILAFDLQDLKTFSEWLGAASAPGVLVRELKFLALLGLLAGAASVGAGRQPA